MLGVRNVAGQWASVLEIAIDLALDKKDPQKKRERRLAREERKANQAEREQDDETKPCLAKVSSSTEVPKQAESSGKRSRYISSCPLTYRHAGRDFRLTDVHGRVIHEIVA